MSDIFKKLRDNWPVVGHLTVGIVEVVSVDHIGNVKVRTDDDVERCIPKRRLIGRPPSDLVGKEMEFNVRQNGGGIKFDDLVVVRKRKV